MNNSILPNNEVIEFEDRTYTNPQVSLDEGLAFIDNLRGLQNQNNAEINTQTYNLGTAVPSSLGGLTGGEGYFTARLQTPQSTSLAANLRATAQAKALNEVLSNELAMQKQRYNNAYKAAQRRAGSYGGGGGGNNPSNPSVDDFIETEATDGGSTSPIGKTSVSDNSFWDNIAGKGDWTISYEKDGKTYYGNVHYKTGISGDRYTGIDTSTGMSYGGQNALNFLQGIINSGGKVYDPNGKEVDAQTALTGDYGRR